MKQAMGELNMTLIVVILIAVLSVFFFSFLWPGLKANFRRDMRCDEAICPASAGETPVNGMINCRMPGESETFSCAWKG